MLDRICKFLKDKNPQLAESSKLKKSEDPHVVKLGTTKTAWVNFDTIVTNMERKHEHVLSYIATELGVECVLSQDNNLIIQGNIMAKKVEGLYKRYILNYVRCGNCRGDSTKLERDPSTRLYVLECKQCGATRSTAAIKAGFQAVRRGERARARQ